MIRVVVIRVGTRIERATVYRESEREEEVVASVVTTACGEDSKLEVMASVLSYCTF